MKVQPCTNGKPTSRCVSHNNHECASCNVGFSLQKFKGFYTCAKILHHDDSKKLDSNPSAFNFSGLKSWIREYTAGVYTSIDYSGTISRIMEKISELKDGMKWDDQ